jgi:hypothetical protein
VSACNLEVVRFIEECNALALMHCHSVTHPRLVVCVNVGQGFVDVCVGEADAGVFEVRGVAGECGAGLSLAVFC